MDGRCIRYGLRFGHGGLGLRVVIGSNAPSNGARRAAGSPARRLASGPIAAGDAQALHRAVDNMVSIAVRLARPGSDLTLAVGSRGVWLPCSRPIYRRYGLAAILGRLGRRNG